MNPLIKDNTGLIEWLRVKIAEAEQTVRAREQMEASWKSGSDAEWAEVAERCGGKPRSKTERLKLSEAQGRIVEKSRHNLAMLNAVLAATQHGLDLEAQVGRLRRDSERLDLLIKQGPPGANEGVGLNKETWYLAICQISDDIRTDAEAVRLALDATHGLKAATGAEGEK